MTVIDSEGKEQQVQPCFEFQTEADLLNDAGIDWAYYAAEPDQLGYIWSAYAAIDHIRNSPQWQEHVLPVDRVIADIGRIGFRPSPGSRPGTRCRSTRSTASARGRTGPHR